MKKINLVLGSSGFISRSFLNSNTNKFRFFIGFDKKKININLKNTKFVNLNLCNFKKLNLYIKKINKIYNIEEIWHFAANSDIQKGTKNPNIDFKDTFLTTFNIINCLTINKINIKKFIFASSSAVYGFKNHIKIKEDIGNLQPISNYGAMKLSCENILSSYSHLTNTNCFIIRFPNVVGSGLTHGLIFDLIKKFKKNNKILPILGNGFQKKQYLHVTDLIQAMNLVVRKKKATDLYNIYNISGEDSGIFVRDIVKQFIKINNIKPKILYEKKINGWPGDIPSFKFNINKIKKIGWKPKYNSKKSIQKCIMENIIKK
jgi:UDP-glucose 4-epimerase